MQHPHGDENASIQRDEGLTPTLSETLNTINASVNSTLDFDEIMRRAIATSSEAIGADTGVATLRDGGEWVVRHVYGASQDIVGNRISPDRARIPELVAASREVLAISDAEADDRLDLNATREYGIRSVLALPLVAGDRVMGAIVYRFKSRVMHFSQAELDFAAKLAASISMAMEHARLFQELESSSKQITEVLESITDAFLALDTGWRYTYVNGEAERLLQRQRDDLLGCSIWEEYPASIGGVFHQECHRAMAEHVPVTFEHYSATVGKWFENHIYPSPSGLSVFFHDVTDHRQREELGELLNRINTAINSTVDFGEIIETVMTYSMTAFDAEAATVTRWEDGHWVPGYQIGLGEEIIGERFSNEHAPIAAATAQSRDVVAIEDVASLPVSAFSLIRRVRALSTISVPLIVRGEVTGVLVFSSRSRQTVFSHAQIDFARKLSASVSLALDNADLFRNLLAESDERGRLLERMNLLVEASQIILKADTREDLLQTVVSSARDLTGAQAAALRLEPAPGLLQAVLRGRDGSARGYVTISDKADGGKFTPGDEALLNQLAATASLALQHMEARSEAEQRAQEAEEGRRTLDALMEFVPEGILITDGPDARLRMVSRYGKHLVRRRGSDEDVSVGDPTDWSICSADGATRPDPGDLPVMRVIRDGEVITEEEWLMAGSDGSKNPHARERGSDMRSERKRNRLHSRLARHKQHQADPCRP